MWPVFQDLLGPGAAPGLWGYLDPGTGSMLFQVLIAGLLSALFCAKSTYLHMRQIVFGQRNRT
jgi:hypothetical protein